MGVPVQQLGKFRYSFLQPEDPLWFKVNREFARRGLDYPSHSNQVAVAEDDEGRISFFMIQATLHAEPLYLDFHHRNTQVLPNLLAMVQAWIERITEKGREVYVVADTPESIALCEHMGMELVEQPVYRTKVTKP